MLFYNFRVVFKFIFNKKWYYLVGLIEYGIWFFENVKYFLKILIFFYYVYLEEYVMGFEVYCKIGVSKMFCLRLGSIIVLRGIIFFRTGKFLCIVKIMSFRIYIKFLDRYIFVWR